MRVEGDLAVVSLTAITVGFKMIYFVVFGGVGTAVYNSPPESYPHDPMIALYRQQYLLPVPVHGQVCVPNDAALRDIPSAEMALLCMLQGVYELLRRLACVLVWKHSGEQWLIHL